MTPPVSSSQGYLVVLEPHPDLKQKLLRMLHEAARGLASHQLSVLECSREELPEVPWISVRGVFIGPSLFSAAGAIAQLIPPAIPRSNIAAVLGPSEFDLYTRSGAVPPVTIPMLSLSATEKFTDFLELCQHWSPSTLRATGGPLVVGIAHIKGGVGGTTVSNALASCWARHGCPSVLYDNDPVAPLLRSWAGARGLIAHGGPVEYVRGYEPNLGFVSEFQDISAILSSPPVDWRLVVLDLGRIVPSDFERDTLANRCNHICLVFDDSRAALDQTLLAITRFREAKARPPAVLQRPPGIVEGRGRRWSLVLNAYTGQTLALEEIVGHIKALQFFPPDTELFTLPYVSSAQDWSSGNQSFYDASETRVREIIRKVAVSISPFSYETMTKKGGRIQREQKIGE